MKQTFLLLVLLPALSLYAQNWSTSGGSNSRSGNSKITGPASASNPAWAVNSPNPTVVGQNVYTFGDRFVTSRASAGFSDVLIECRRLQDGALAWTSPFIANGSKLYCMGFSEDAVYACDYATDSVYALNPGDGSIKWRGEMKSYSYGARESVAYACNGDIILNGPVGSALSTMRLNKDNGEVVWTNNNLYAVGPIRGLAATASRVYRIKGAINQPIQLLAIDIETGASLYSTPGLPGDGDQENPIALGHDGRIYFWRDNGALYSFTDTGSGFAQNWSFQPVSSHHGGSNGQLAIGVNNDIYTFDADKVVRISHGSGALLHVSQVQVMGGNITIGADSTVYVNNENGTVYAFSADLQQLLWQYSTPLNAFGNCILAKEGTMVLTAAGTSITAFAPGPDRKPVADFRVSSRKVLTGQPLSFYDQSSFGPTAWQWSFPGASISSTADPNPEGIVYASPGVYSVSLVASNSHGADSLARQCYIEVELNTRTAERADAGLVSVYPNPFGGEFSMVVPRQLEGERFQVVNSQGQLVREGVAGEGVTRVELRGCASGIYFLRVGGRVYKLAKQG